MLRNKNAGNSVQKDIPKPEIIGWQTEPGPLARNSYPGRIQHSLGAIKAEACRHCASGDYADDWPP